MGGRGRESWERETIVRLTVEGGRMQDICCCGAGAGAGAGADACDISTHTHVNVRYEYISEHTRTTHVFRNPPLGVEAGRLLLDMLRGCPTLLKRHVLSLLHVIVRGTRLFNTKS